MPGSANHVSLEQGQQNFAELGVAERRYRGEGRAAFATDANRARAIVAMRYVDHAGNIAQDYPINPNGSPEGIAGLTTPDGRFTIAMPHPERVFRTVQMSWHPDDWGEDSPWMRLFRNARAWLG